MMDTLGLLQSKWGWKSFDLNLQETWLHDSINIPKTKLVAYIYI